MNNRFIKFWFRYCICFAFVAIEYFVNHNDNLAIILAIFFATYIISGTIIDCKDD